MALRFSTGLRNKRLDHQAKVQNIVTGTTISFGDGDGSSGRDTIKDSGNGLAGFEVYDLIKVFGSTNNNGEYEILSVVAGVVEVAAESLTTEAASAQVILASSRGGSLKDLFRNGVLDIYSGTQPTTADQTESGTKLARVTISSGVFTPGSGVNGINLGDSTAGVIAKRANEVWSGVGLVDGTAGWFRFYDNSATTGASATAVRFDGAIATTGAQMNMSNTSVSVGGTTTIGTVAITDPMS
jgi:hypothetical protein